MKRFYAAPAFRSQAPGRGFASKAAAEHWAEQAARTYRIGYAVWQRNGGRLKLLRQLPAPPAAA